MIVGAGAVGSSIAGWLAPSNPGLSLLARGETLEVLRRRGLKSYLKGCRSTAAAMPVRAIGSLAEAAPPDVVVVTVKNYDLEAVCRDLRAQLGDREPIVVGLQNGVKNQQVLPRYFSRVVYGVVCYNSWREGPGEVGHEKRGHVIVGTPANDRGEEVRAVAGILGPHMDCVVTDRLRDAVHSKLVINIANPVMALVGARRRRVESFDLLVRTLLALHLEAIGLLESAGYHEHRLGHVPSWRSFRIGRNLPAPVATSFFRRGTRTIGLNSMAQDVFGGRGSTELDEINGYMLGLAERAGVSTPVNETVYRAAKERFGTDFRPVSERELWSMVEQNVGDAPEARAPAG
ncbi:MAG: 2-dehydropantoate 2-reductase [Nitrososphaerales archaeon]